MVRAGGIDHALADDRRRVARLAGEDECCDHSAHDRGPQQHQEGTEIPAHALSCTTPRIDAGLRDWRTLQPTRRYSAPVQVRLIVNPLASAVGDRIVDGVTARLAAVCDLEVVRTEYPGHARALAAAATDVAVALGGDGTANEVVNGLPAGVGFSMLPGGASSVFARQIGFTDEPLYRRRPARPRARPGPCPDDRPRPAGRPPLHLRRVGRLRRRGHPRRRRCALGPARLSPSGRLAGRGGLAPCPARRRLRAA